MGSKIPECWLRDTEGEQAIPLSHGPQNLEENNENTNHQPSTNLTSCPTLYPILPIGPQTPPINGHFHRNDISTANPEDNNAAWNHRQSSQYERNIPSSPTPLPTHTHGHFHWINPGVYPVWTPLQLLSQEIQHMSGCYANVGASPCCSNQSEHCRRCTVPRLYHHRCANVHNVPSYTYPHSQSSHVSASNPAPSYHPPRNAPPSHPSRITLPFHPSRNAPPSHPSRNVHPSHHSRNALQFHPLRNTLPFHPSRNTLPFHLSRNAPPFHPRFPCSPPTVYAPPFVPHARSLTKETFHAPLKDHGSSPKSCPHASDHSGCGRRMCHLPPHVMSYVDHFGRTWTCQPERRGDRNVGSVDGKSVISDQLVAPGRSAIDNVLSSPSTEQIPRSVGDLSPDAHSNSAACFYGYGLSRGEQRNCDDATPQSSETRREVPGGTSRDGEKSARNARKKLVRKRSTTESSDSDNNNPTNINLNSPDDDSKRLNRGCKPKTFATLGWTPNCNTFEESDSSTWFDSVDRRKSARNKPAHRNVNNARSNCAGSSGRPRFTAANTSPIESLTLLDDRIQRIVSARQTTNFYEPATPDADAASIVINTRDGPATDAINEEIEFVDSQSPCRAARDYPRAIRPPFYYPPVWEHVLEDTERQNHVHAVGDYGEGLNTNDILDRLPPISFYINAHERDLESPLDANTSFLEFMAMSSDEDEETVPVRPAMLTPRNGPSNGRVYGRSEIRVGENRNSLERRPRLRNRGGMTSREPTVDEMRIGSTAMNNAVGNDTMTASGGHGNAPSVEDIIKAMVNLGVGLNANNVSSYRDIVMKLRGPGNNTRAQVNNTKINIIDTTNMQSARVNGIGSVNNKQLCKKIRSAHNVTDSSGQCTSSMGMNVNQNATPSNREATDDKRYNHLERNTREARGNEVRREAWDNMRIDIDNNASIRDKKASNSLPAGMNYNQSRRDWEIRNRNTTTLRERQYSFEAIRNNWEMSNINQRIINNVSLNNREAAGLSYASGTRGHAASTTPAPIATAETNLMPTLNNLGTTTRDRTDNNAFTNGRRAGPSNDSIPRPRGTLRSMMDEERATDEDIQMVTNVKEEEESRRMKGEDGSSESKENGNREESRGGEGRTEEYEMGDVISNRRESESRQDLLESNRQVVEQSRDNVVDYQQNEHCEDSRENCRHMEEQQTRNDLVDYEVEAGREEESLLNNGNEPQFQRNDDNLELKESEDVADCCHVQ